VPRKIESPVRRRSRFTRLQIGLHCRVGQDAADRSAPRALPLDTVSVAEAGSLPKLQHRSRPYIATGTCRAAGVARTAEKLSRA
jgi:hypothetical protein